MSLTTAMLREKRRRRMLREMNPHGEAVVAAALFRDRLEAAGGPMALWESLGEDERDLCREIADEVRRSPGEDRT